MTGAADLRCGRGTAVYRGATLVHQAASRSPMPSKYTNHMPQPQLLLTQLTPNLIAVVRGHACCTQPHHWRRDMEDRYKQFSLFTRHDVRECLQAVFGYAYGLGDPEGATRRADQPPPLDRAKMGFRQAGVMSIAAHMLSNASLHPSSKSAVRVAADVAAIAKAFIKPSAGDGKSAQSAGGQGDEVTAWMGQGNEALEASGFFETGGAQSHEVTSDKLPPSSKAAGQTFDEAKVRDARDAAPDRPGSAATSVESRQPRGVSWHGIRSRRGSGGGGLEEGPSSTHGEVQELRQAVAEMGSQLQQMSKLLGTLVGKNVPQSARAPAAMLDD